MLEAVLTKGESLLPPELLDDLAEKLAEFHPLQNLRQRRQDGASIQALPECSTAFAIAACNDAACARRPASHRRQKTSDLIRSAARIPGGAGGPASRWPRRRR